MSSNGLLIFKGTLVEEEFDADNTPEFMRELCVLPPAFFDELLPLLTSGPIEALMDLRQPSMSPAMRYLPVSSVSCPVPLIFLDATYFSIFRFMDEFQWFLMALSVRPGSSLAISAHLFPISLCDCKISRSSSSDHGALQMSGLR